MSLFITGVFGALGSNLLIKLIEKQPNFKIIATDLPKSLNSDYYPKLKELLGQEDKIQYFSLDITDKEAFEKLLIKINPSYIIHLAADINVTRSPKMVERSLKVNYIPLITILNYAQEYHVKRVILTGTCEEYGFNDSPFNEEQSPQPVSPYSLAKTLGAVTSMFFHRIYDLPVVFLRPFTFFGPYQRGEMFIPSLFRAIFRNESDFRMSSGDQLREFNYAPEIAEAYINALTASNIDGEIINLGRGQGVSLNEVAEKILKITKSPIKVIKGGVPYRKHELMSIITNPSKAERLLNWKVKMTVDEALSETYEWYKSYPKFLV